MGLIIFSLILWFNYSVCVANFFSQIDNFFTSWKDDLVIVTALNILILFNSIICLFSPHVSHKINPYFFDYSRKNAAISYGCIIVLTLLLTYSFYRTISVNGRVTSTTLFEYSIIIFIIGFLYSARKSISRLLLCVVSLAYIIFDLLYGNRVTALQLIICFFLINVSHKLKPFQVIPIVIFGVLFFSFIGMLRTDFSLNAQSLNRLFEGLINERLALDTSYSAFYTSLTFLKTEGMLSFGERMHMFVLFIASIFIGGNVDGSNLAAYTRSYFTHYYGGILPYFGHFYLGIIGVIIISFYVVFLVRKFIYSKKAFSGYRLCLAIYFTSSIPRWYLYSPSSILRGFLLMSLVYIACHVFHISFISTEGHLKIKQTNRKVL